MNSKSTYEDRSQVAEASSLDKSQYDIYKYLFECIDNLAEDTFLNYPGLAKLNLNERVQGKTFLHMSCERNLKRTVEYLLNNGADINAKDTRRQWTALQIAGTMGFFKIFQMLLENKPKPTIPSTLLVRMCEYSAFGPEVELSHQKCVGLLLENTTDKDDIGVNHPNKFGRTPLHYAVRYLNEETVMELLRRGASLANTDSKGGMPVDDINSNILEKHLDNCVTRRTPNVLTEEECVMQIIDFDYKTCIPTHHCVNNFRKRLKEDILKYKRGLYPEIDVILAICKQDNLKHLLEHPVLNSFFVLKLQKVSWFLHFHFWLQILFTVTFFWCYLSESPKSKFSSLGFEIYLCISFYAICVLLFICKLLFIFKYKPRQSPQSLIISVIFDLSWIISTGFTIISIALQVFIEDVYDICSAMGILLFAVKLTLSIGQHPWFSHFPTMFKIVCIDGMMFILYYIVLIAAFIVIFLRMFDGFETEQNKSNLWLAFVNFLAMFAGEINAGSVGITNKNSFVFVAFVFFFPIILFNLLVAIAFNDIGKISTDAKFYDMKERASYVEYLEKLFLTGSKFPLLRARLLQPKRKAVMVLRNFEEIGPISTSLDVTNTIVITKMDKNVILKTKDVILRKQLKIEPIEGHIKEIKTKLQELNEKTMRPMSQISMCSESLNILNSVESTL